MPSDRTTGVRVPALTSVTAYQDAKQRQEHNVLPNLPSHRYRYSVWHDVRPSLGPRGNELRAPRVRNGPPVKDEMFYQLRDENEKRVHHTLRGRERQDYRDGTENWEEAEHVNLSYQEMQHDYQRAELARVLKRLTSATTVVLSHNSLQRLGTVSLPAAQRVELSNNYIDSFKHLPRLPQVKVLLLTDNVIPDLRGLAEALGKSPIHSLTLKGNPVAFTLNYRQNVFASLPGLGVLDGIPRRPEDDEFFPDHNGGDQADARAARPGGCVLM